ncbi:flagellar basal body protein [Rhizobium sp. LjRoot30]|uniref:flagellar basal body rod protein FlgC n=1 Tax=Rhizobium sp. LjRoot30 TaxID=3342320 RepID=UPI003ECF2A67
MSISGMMNTAVSGLLAQSTRVGAIANNVANAGTPGYQRQETTLSSSPSGGVSATVVPTGEGVDLAGEFTDLISAELSYKTNAAVFETGAEIWDVLMSIKRD